MKWFIYIPNDGHWELPYTGSNAKDAKVSARLMLNIPRLPSRSFVCKG